MRPNFTICGQTRDDRIEAIGYNYESDYRFELDYPRITTATGINFFDFLKRRHLAPLIVVIAEAARFEPINDFKPTQ
jgi:hypothetical protein